MGERLSKILYKIEQILIKKVGGKKSPAYIMLITPSFL